MLKDNENARYSRLVTPARLRWHLDALLFALKAWLYVLIFLELVLLAYVLRALA